MTGKEFSEFRKRMGWSIVETAIQLGIARGTVAKHEKADEVGLTVALACAARANGIPPLGGAPAPKADAIV